MSTHYDFNVFERKAKEFVVNGQFDEALRLYFFMADGDPSLDGGYLGMKIGECYEAVGVFYAAKYFHERAVEENPEVRNSSKLAIERLRKLVDITDLLEELPNVEFKTKEYSDLGPLEKQAYKFTVTGQFDKARRIYFHIAEGDISLGGGYFASKIAECYDASGPSFAAKYWYGLAIAENPEKFRGCKQAIERLEKIVYIDDLLKD